MTQLATLEINRRIVAIVKFGIAGLIADGFNAGEYFQVTIDPAKISPSGEFIRFGTYEGDEILGWQRLEAITVIERLADWPYDQDAPLLKFGVKESINMLLPTNTIQG